MSEALRLADALNKAAPFADYHIIHDAAALLRTQAARIAELESAITATLTEHAELADGDDCTLIRLKNALEAKAAP